MAPSSCSSSIVPAKAEPVHSSTSDGETPATSDGFGFGSGSGGGGGASSLYSACIAFASRRKAAACASRSSAPPGGSADAASRSPRSRGGGLLFGLSAVLMGSVVSSNAATGFIIFPAAADSTARDVYERIARARAPNLRALRFPAGFRTGFSCSAGDALSLLGLTLASRIV